MSIKCEKVSLALIAVALGACSAYGDRQVFEVDSVAALTNAIDRANASPGESGAQFDVIKLAAGVTFDLSSLSSYTSPDGLWGTMSAPANTSHGTSCLWFKKKIHFEGADTTHWAEKKSTQESVLDGGNRARIIYVYGQLDGALSTFKHIVFANGKADSSGNGGGLFSVGPSIYSPGTWNRDTTGFVTNCVFRACSAKEGGGSYKYNVFGSCFKDCTATGNGGGAYGTGNNGSNFGNVATNRFDACVFSGCTAADHGGGIYHDASHVLEGSLAGYIANCVFENCTSKNGGGGVYLNVGGLIRDCEFTGNACTANNGGALWNGTAVGCTFRDNRHCDQVWGRGGACLNVQCTRCTFSGLGDVCGGSLDRCVFDGVADVQVIRTASSEPTVAATNCLICNSSAVYLANAGASAGGIEFANCTFAGNTVGVGTTAYATAQGEDNGLAGVAYCQSGFVTLKNCLFSGNRRKLAGEETYCASDLRLKGTTASVTLSHCLFTAAEAPSDYQSASGVETLVQGDPRFVAGNPDYPGLPYYSILRVSPARNAGANAPWMADAQDLAGRSRIYDSAVDIGCYECRIPPGLTITVQ